MLVLPPRNSRSRLRSSELVVVGLFPRIIRHANYASRCAPDRTGKWHSFGPLDVRPWRTVDSRPRFIQQSSKDNGGDFHRWRPMTARRPRVGQAHRLDSRGRRGRRGDRRRLAAHLVRHRGTGSGFQHPRHDDGERQERAGAVDQRSQTYPTAVPSTCSPSISTASPSTSAELGADRRPPGSIRARRSPHR